MFCVKVKIRILDNLCFCLFFVALRVMMSLDGYCWATVGCCLVNIIELNNTGNKTVTGAGKSDSNNIIVAINISSAIWTFLFSCTFNSLELRLDIKRQRHWKTEQGEVMSCSPHESVLHIKVMLRQSGDTKSLVSVNLVWMKAMGVKGYI